MRQESRKETMEGKVGNDEGHGEKEIQEKQEKNN